MRTPTRAESRAGVPARPSRPSLLVPYYEHPADRPAEWDALVAAAPRLYGVVLNPAGGPGGAPDPAFIRVAGRLRAAGVRLLGYADTGYGRRPVTEVIRDLTRYQAWYGTDGTFLDQVAAGLGEFEYYRRLAAAVWGAGRATLVLNHGTPPHPAYARIADLVVTFEGTWETYREQPLTPWPGGTRGLGSQVCHLVYGVPPDIDVGGLALTRGASVHCAVPGVGDHPWGTLPHALEPT
ncbi:spherulation-specific family 4 protein [Streptomyces sp. CA-210063]|uniref:spherulation-specific family 4 protein n=1 Tax=Streptomyces sp. CA-210063 TaxID=2801029 RepID=UPI00214CDF48|nr:spherulation-specific family 4 protein [Streptomyces sp. CA-210063]UUU34472.1 spherulation-specific family 4 protein [Streptomyces sp. CA-210063]